MAHKIVLFGEGDQVHMVGRKLANAQLTFAVCQDIAQCVALARQFTPSVLALVVDANSTQGREYMATLTMEPATSATPQIVFSKAVPLEAALNCFAGGVAGILDQDQDGSQLAKQITELVGVSPEDPRQRQAAAPGGSATLRRIGRYMQIWTQSARVTIEGAPAGSASISWSEGAFESASYDAKVGNDAAAALLQTSGSHAWKFSRAAPAAPTPAAHGQAPTEPTEESLDLVIDLLPEDYEPTAIPIADIESAHLPPLRVLLVDDDPSLLSMYERSFAARGWDIQTKEDGAQGFAHALTWRPDLIVSDIMMPETDGWGFLGLVRGDHRLRETPFVLLSCHTEFLGKLRALDAGADDYLEKGLRPTQVLERLLAVVHVRRQLRAVAAPGQSFGGQLLSVGAQYLLRVLAEKAVTGRLRATSRWGVVEVSHERGVITDARLISGDVVEEGTFALQTLLSLDDAHFSFTPEAPIKGGFDTPFDSIADSLCASLNHRRDASDEQMFSRNEGLACLKPRLRDFYLAACSDIVRPIAERLFNGAPPREVLAGGASPVLVEAVVKDLLRKGVARFSDVAPAT